MRMRMRMRPLSVARPWRARVHRRQGGLLRGLGTVGIATLRHRQAVSLEHLGGLAMGQALATIGEDLVDQPVAEPRVE